MNMDLANLATLLFISGNVHPYPGPISNHPHPRHPCSICHLDVGRDSLQCSACLKWVHFLCSFLPMLTFAQSVQLALQWAGDAQRAIPKRKLAPPLRPVSLLCRLRPLLPQGSPHYRLAFITHIDLGASHVTLAPFALSM